MCLGLLSYGSCSFPKLWLKCMRKPSVRVLEAHIHKLGHALAHLHRMLQALAIKLLTPEAPWLLRPAYHTA